ALLAEFSAITWEELDYTHEINNAERFARLFAGNKGVYIPSVYRDHSTRRVITLEDVSAIKITDYDAITAAGVDRRDVARRLVNTYLWMVFTQRFYHADPHPGNLFVYPLDPDTPTQSGFHADGQPLLGRPFYLIFIDFGMAGHLTPEIEAGLREALIALTTRDPKRLIASYTQLGVILPGADMERIEAATRSVFDRVWGMSMSEIKDMQYTEMMDLGREFKDLLFAMPFQVPQDFIILARAVGILSGLCTGLNPDFDPWAEVAPFVNQMLAEHNIGFRLPPKITPRDLLNPNTVRALLSGDHREWLTDTGLDLARRAIQLPIMAETVFARAERGDLVVQAAASPAMQRDLRRLERAAYRLTYAMVFAGLAISSTVLYTAGESTLSIGGFVLAGLAGLRVVFGGGRS
ncbi:MAG: AarF/ABC1/UbiB kinase family protein, partial [Anaerolineae bacterium]|nr:AarF/ABC1/UbiB kinase family protein [Anaerolineae bacterium]